MVEAETRMVLRPPQPVHSTRSPPHMICAYAGSKVVAWDREQT